MRRALSSAWGLLIARDPERGSPRGRLERALELGHQQGVSADLLWNAGRRAEALKLARSALVETLQAVATYRALALDAHADPAAALRAVRGLALPAATQGALTQVALGDPSLAQDPTEGPARLPLLDADVTAADGVLFHRHRRAQRRLARLDGARLPSDRRAARRLRLLALVAVLAVAAYGLRPPPAVRVDASDAFGETYAVANLVDGKWEKREHEWLLPNGTSGWARIRLAKPRALASVRLRNALHPPYRSYGTRAFRLELRARGRTVQSHSGEFPAPDPNAAWLEVPFPTAPEADEVRIHIDSYYGVGGGLSEVTLHWTGGPG